MKSSTASRSDIMAEVSKVAEHPLAKLALQVVQALLVTAAIGSYNGISGSLETIKTQLATIQTDGALAKQRLDTLERSNDAQNTQIDTLRTETQRLSFEVSRMNTPKAKQ